MKLSKSIFLALCALVFLANAQAQRYQNAIGVRIDNGLSLTYQQYITNGWTVEGLLHTPFRASDDLGFSVLAEKHRKILFRGLNLYAGGGGHYYFKNAKNSEPGEVHNNVYGLSGILGGEISIGKLNISADWKPELHLAGDMVRPFEWTGAAISVRMILNKRDRNQWWKFNKNKKKKKGKRFFGILYED